LSTEGSFCQKINRSHAHDSRTNRKKEKKIESRIIVNGGFAEDGPLEAEHRVTEGRVQLVDRGKFLEKNCGVSCMLKRIKK